MEGGMRKRDFLAAGLGLGAGLAASAMLQPASGQAPAAPPAGGGRGKLPNRAARTTQLFKAPAPYPNALASAPEGLWVAQQHLTPDEARGAGVAVQPGKELVWLMDMNGKLLQTRESNASNTSGLAVGNGSLWVMSNTSDAATGIHQVDIASGRQTAQRQIPLSPNNVTGGVHGGQWHDGKLWIANNRMRSLMRIDPQTWTGELQFPIASPPGMGRFHDFTFDKDGTILVVIANEGSKSHADNVAGLMRVDATTGRAIETITFAPGSCDPHGLAYHNGRLISCDAGYHPGWADHDSPSSGWIFRIDIV
jgi:hypothetical protein